MTNLDAQPEEAESYVEVWSDLVSITDLTKALAICSLTTAAGLGIAAFTGASEFFCGLTGSVLGFIIATIVIAPKREIEER